MNYDTAVDSLRSFYEQGYRMMRLTDFVDGNIRGELTLGKKSDSEETAARERKVRAWLEEMGW